MVVEQPGGTAAHARAGLPASSWRRRAGLAVAVSAWLYLASALGVWGLLRAADLWWPATLLMFGPRWLLALPLAPLIGAAALLRRRALGPMLLALVLVLGPATGFCIPWQLLRPGAPSGTRLRLLTCNMHYGKRDPAPLDRLLAQARPEVVALQEWRTSNRSKTLAQDEWHLRRTSALFLASRYPIRQAAGIGVHSDSDKGSAMRYELETPAGVVTLFSLHLASPREGLEEVIHERWRGAAELQAGTELRCEQSEYLAREARRVQGPLLLAGDFNTPPESVLFRRQWGRYTDAFAAAGWGWGHTFFSRWSAVRIDHILAGPGWRCDHCWVGPDVGSPHRPVLADLTWPAAMPPADR